MGNTLQIIQDLGFTAIAMGTPILFAALGELIAEKSGVQNLGIEGMMYVGAISAFLSGLIFAGMGMTGFLPLLLIVIISGIFGGIMALLHGFMTLTLKANQIVSGLALTIFGTALAYYMGTVLIKNPQAILSNKFGNIGIFNGIHVPVLGEVMRIFLSQDFYVYLSYLLIIGSIIYIYKTKKGLNLRAIGENPGAADSLGVKVKKMRYIYVVIGGIMAGIGGGALIIASSSVGKWGQGMVAGRGWIAIALVIFARWNPKILIWGAYLFGLALALESRAQVYGWFSNIIILKMVPYLLTIIVLIVSFILSKSKDIGEPASLGQPYDRESR